MDQVLNQVASGVVYSLGALTSIVLTVINERGSTCEDLLLEMAMAADENVFTEAGVNWSTIGSFVGSFLSQQTGGIPSIQNFLDLMKALKGESE
jgi:hypothetical protein